jgi:hypothetical protein
VRHRGVKLLAGWAELFGSPNDSRRPPDCAYRRSHLTLATARVGQLFEVDEGQIQIYKNNSRILGGSLVLFHSHVQHARKRDMRGIPSA